MYGSIREPSPERDEFLDEILKIARMFWRKPGPKKAIANSAMRRPTETAQISPSEVKWIEDKALEIARHRGYKDRSDFHSFLVTDGISAFQASLASPLVTGDEDFDVRTHARYQAQLAMDAKARRSQSSIDVRTKAFEDWTEVADTGNRGYLLELMGSAVCNLPTPRREIIEGFLDGLSRPEIAACLGMSETAVWRQRGIALIELREKLSSDGERFYRDPKKKYGRWRTS
jgi:hypothetical protein